MLNEHLKKQKELRVKLNKLNQELDSVFSDIIACELEFINILKGSKWSLFKNGWGGFTLKLLERNEELSKLFDGIWSIDETGLMPEEIHLEKEDDVWYITAAENYEDTSIIPFIKLFEFELNADAAKEKLVTEWDTKVGEINNFILLTEFYDATKI